VLVLLLEIVNLKEMFLFLCISLSRMCLVVVGLFGVERLCDQFCFV